jgi:hypothetical protein
MSLPKINYPTFTVEIPSTKKKTTFRPFLVKEEKILLMAKASEDETDILLAIKQIVNNCAIDPKFDVNQLAIFDMEYCFLKIRAASVSDVISVSYNDFEDKKNYDFEIKLNDVTVEFPKEITNTIKITPTTGITLKYPSSSLYEDKEFLNSGEETFFQLIIRCIDKIYEEDNMYDAKNYTNKELEEFLESLDVKTFESVQNFMLNQPSLKYVIEYKNSLGNDRKIELKSLTDFFTFR